MLLYIVDNPMSIIITLFTLCILFSTIGTIGDEPFVYGTLPDLIENIRDIVDNLPWSVWQFINVLSDCTAIGNLDHCLKQDCDIIAI